MFEKYILYYVTLLCLISYAEHKNQTEPDAVDIRKMFIEEGIIPDVIPDCPNKLCTVVYKGKPIKPGETLRRPRVLYEPSVTWEADNDTFYTLYMSGSAITRPKYPMVTRTKNSRELVEWENWVVINIPGCDIEKGDFLASYLAPRLDGDRERFVILVYEQPRNYSFRGFSLKNELEFPDQFRVADFVKFHEFTGPIAGNYFIVDSRKIIQ